MKTLLLFVCVMALTASSVAQRTVPSGLKAVPYGNSPHPRLVIKPDEGIPTKVAPLPASHVRPKSTNSLIDTVWFGSSANAYTLLVPQQRAIWYDNRLNVIMGTFRGNNSTDYPLMTYLTGDDVANYFLYNNGSPFIKRVGIADGTKHRLPSGVIHTPVGYPITDSLYSVIEGPETDSTNWTFNYKVSVKNDGSNLNVQKDVSVNNEALCQGLTATEDGYVHFTGESYTSDYLHSTLRMRNGSFNSNSIPSWTNTDILLDDKVNRKPSDNTLITYFGEANMAWNNDGSVGYTIVRGSDNRPSSKPSLVPLLFKSTDKGETWTQLPYHEFGNDQEITDWILPVTGNPAVYKPLFSEIGLTVDYYNNPHIFSIIRGAASQNPDSLTYVWSLPIGGVSHDADNNYFELWIDPAGAWNVRHIDTVWADDVTPDISFYYSSTGNVGWNHRLQASRSYDGKAVFGVWTDSDYLFWGNDKYNLNPDLFVFCHQVVTGEMSYKPNVTRFSDIWGGNYFHFVSPVAIDIWPSSWFPDDYEIPITVEDIFSTWNNADNPVYHILVTGILTVGMTDHPDNPATSVTIYPNPSSGKVSFEITLDKIRNVSVAVTNLTGQAVSSHDYATLTKGTHKLEFDNSALGSGVYLCTFLLGDQKITRKMVIR